MEDDVRCVAAPVLNHEGKTVAAISLSGPRTRMSDQYLYEEMVPLVTDTAKQVSHLMGWDDHWLKQ
jgi:DNA-binding IclR family transcriptional regulator